jgi:glycosyltransferase involved in cell wall biosynthesis
MPFAHSVQHLPNERFWGKWFSPDRRDLMPKPRPLKVFQPLNFFELATSYLGFLPEPLAFSLRAFREMAARLRAGQRYDIVHDVQCLGYGILGIRKLGLPVVTTVHHPLTIDRRASLNRDQNLREAIGTMTFYPSTMQSFVARQLDGLFTSSTVSAQAIGQDFGVRPERIRMVSNGVDTEFFQPDPKVCRHDNEILCIGRASDPNKGIGTLIEALARLPQPLRLRLVDVDHADHPARIAAQKLGCADRLQITGRIKAAELVALYQRSSLVVVPSRYEGFGLPAVEAMACGTPVVACAAGALPEVMNLTGGGMLVPRDNAESLAEAIAHFMARPELRSQLGKLGRARVEEVYAWPRVARVTASAYADFIARGRPASTTTSARAGHERASRSSAVNVD